jgi:hypothetical protein
MFLIKFNVFNLLNPNDQPLVITLKFLILIKQYDGLIVDGSLLNFISVIFKYF